jgi:pimeloyl-ACP methyl ester carboxylesterase
VTVAQPFRTLNVYERPTVGNRPFSQRSEPRRAGDGAKKVACPMLVLWGARGTVGRLYDVMTIWRENASDVRGQSLPGGHFLPEELPDETLAALRPFLDA